MVCPHNGILFSHKKRGTDKCYNMDEPGKKNDAKWKKPVIEGHLLYESIPMKFKNQ